MRKKAIPAVVVNRKAETAMEKALENEQRIIKLEALVRLQGLVIWVVALLATATAFSSF